MKEEYDLMPVPQKAVVFAPVIGGSNLHTPTDRVFEFGGEETRDHKLYLRWKFILERAFHHHDVEGVLYGKNASP